MVSIIAIQKGANPTPFIVTSIFYVVTDIWILILPIPSLWSLHAPKSRRMGLIAMFLVGGIATIAGLVLEYRDAAAMLRSYLDL